MDPEVKINGISRQSGAALVIGLVVLLMLTLLGISSMNMTSLELRISGNTMNRNNAFQSATSRIDHIFNAIGNDPYRINFTNTTVQTPPPLAVGNMVSVSQIVFADGVAGRPPVPRPIDCSALTTTSLGATCNAYEIRVTSTDNVTNAQSAQFQGLVKTGRLRAE